MLFGFESLACGKPEMINEFQPGKHVGSEPCSRNQNLPGYESSMSWSPALALGVVLKQGAAKRRAPRRDL